MINCFPAVQRKQKGGNDREGDVANVAGKARSRDLRRGCNFNQTGLPEPSREGKGEGT